MKIQIQQLSILASIICLCLCSCGYYPVYDPYYVPISRQQENNYYVPSGVNAPLLTEKNDGSFTVGGSLSYKATGGIGLQAAYVPVKHLGLMTSYFSSAYKGASNHFEFGTGYVNKLSEYWSFETYGGVGTGNIKNNHFTGYSNIKSSNYFLQPTITLENKNQTFQFAFVSRFNQVNFKLGDTTFNNDREPYVTEQMTLIANDPTHLFWEPGFIMRAGWKNVLIQAGYQHSTALSDTKIQYVHENFSLGLVLRFNTKQQTKVP